MRKSGHTPGPGQRSPHAVHNTSAADAGTVNVLAQRRQNCTNPNRTGHKHRDRVRVRGVRVDVVV
ncbi:hypothetical protein [Actinocrispum wychmicini]|uniref:Uncharacterized protein n=1 Tax=Actinocrispum wychmicini TaxID=1213861 RepID=A0A4V2S6D9_9PSEU|nr:hypothetical protein [Actinocrispum wychmicini]TCO55640.1 hypothetical protein EV192_10762 [Actinocrispum wychmicini]